MLAGIRFVDAVLMGHTRARAVASLSAMSGTRGVCRQVWHIPACSGRSSAVSLREKAQLFFFSLTAFRSQRVGAERATVLVHVWNGRAWPGVFDFGEVSDVCQVSVCRETHRRSRRLEIVASFGIQATTCKCNQHPFALARTFTSYMFAYLGPD